MALGVSTNLDLNLNELQNIVLQQLGSDPGSPVEGQIWYNTTSNVARYRTDSATIDIGSGVVDTSGTPVANDFARFTDADTIEGRSYAETKSDLSLNLVENTALSTWAGTANITTLGTITTGTWTGTDIAVADGGTGSSTAAGARTNLGLVIGTDVQAWSSVLDATTASFLTADETKLDYITVTGAVNLDTIGSASHTQNTDTGTTATSFDVDSGGTGFKIKNSSGELQVRNLADNAYGDIRVANLTVEGTTTTVNSETVTIDDNIFVLNNNEAGSPTEDAGIEVERGTSANAQLLWDESSDYWAANDGTTTAALCRKYAVNIGDTAATQITVTHNLASEDVTVAVRYAGGTKQAVLADWRVIDSNSIRVDFTTAPSTDEFRVIVTG